MKFKPDWTTWLHAYKRREIDAVFKACPRQLFGRGLELGAGDGFQSTLLSTVVRRLVSIEINKNVLTRQSTADIEYRICSAEEAGDCFGEKSFDIVFSSNLLEHLLDPSVVLRGVHRLLKDDGITVHIMPAPFWKLCQMALYHPANGLVLLERITRQRGLVNYYREARALFRELLEGIPTGSNETMRLAYERELSIGNNPTTGREMPSFIYSLFLPQPHGVSRTHGAEWRAFGKRRWKKVFDDAGFSCIAVRKGPAASGYGLGWERLRAIAERAGLASEYSYIAVKKGYVSAAAGYFMP